MTDEQVEEFALKRGYCGISEHFGVWRGFDVYIPDDSNLGAYGIPMVILVDGENVRMSDYDETFGFLDHHAFVDSCAEYERVFGKPVPATLMESCGGSEIDASAMIDERIELNKPFGA